MRTIKEERIKKYPGIYRILVLNDKTGKYEEPERGNKFKTRRWVKNPDGTKKSVWRSFETLDQAKSFRDGTLIEEGKVSLEKPKERMTLGELIEIWKKDWLPHKFITTQVRYKSYLQHFDYLKHAVVDEIQPVHIDQWITHLKKPEYLGQFNSTRCSYDHEFSVLRVIMNFYVSRYNRNYPLPFIKEHNGMLKVKAKSKVKKDLTIDQFREFMTSLRNICYGTRWEPIYYLALMQYGIYGRIQEPAALHYEDFDLKRNVLTVNKKLVWVRSKDHDDFIEDGAKTNDGKEFNPIPQLALEAFKEWIMRSGIRSGMLFQINGKLITYRQIQNKYDQALEKAGLPFTATHILRHASLTEAYQVCRDLLQVKRFAGHSDLRATERYAKARDEELQKTQRQMDERLSSILPKGAQ